VQAWRRPELFPDHPGPSAWHRNFHKKHKLEQKTLMPNTLRGKTVAILATDGFEQVELLKPKQALEEAGAKTQVVSPKSGKIKGFACLLDRTFAVLRLPSPVKKVSPNLTMAASSSCPGFTRRWYRRASN
jgi:hypothetical protein